MLRAILIGLAQFLEAVAHLASGELFELTRMSIWTDVQDVLPTVAGDLS